MDGWTIEGVVIIGVELAGLFIVYLLWRASRRSPEEIAALDAEREEKERRAADRAARAPAGSSEVRRSD